MRRAYRERRDVMCAALASEMPEAVTWTRTEGGFFVWLTLPPRSDPEAAMAQATEERVVEMPGTQCFPDGRGSHHLRLSFSLQSLDRLPGGVRRLARAIRAGLR